MKLIVTREQRFTRTPDGAVWSQVAYDHHFFERYLDVFDQVCVVARAQEVQALQGDWQRVDGVDVSFIAVPYYLGPWQYLYKSRQARRIAADSIGKNDAVILPIPSQIASTVEPSLRRVGHPYGVEVVGDPYAVFASHVVDHPLRRFFRWWFTRQQMRQCAEACASHYVTEYALQRRYPPSPGSFTVSYSDVALPNEAFASCARVQFHTHGEFRLVTVGSLAQLYKGIDVLIDAVDICVQDGLDLQLSIIGDGKFRPDLERRSAARNLTNRVHFIGQLPAGDAVRAQLDSADLFVLPSRTEGLPRALIEAMARGLPCIGSTAGGIPELLAAEDMVPPGDANALAQKIRGLSSDPDHMRQMSARNLEKAKNHHERILRERRIEFYTAVRDRTQAWLEKSGLKN